MTNICCFSVWTYRYRLLGRTGKDNNTPQSVQKSTYQSFMSELLHNGRLLKEGLRGHGALSQRFHSHFILVLPLAIENLPEIASTEPKKSTFYSLLVNRKLKNNRPSQQLDFIAGNFPFIPVGGSQVPHGGFRLPAGFGQNMAQSVSVFCQNKMIIIEIK